MDNVRPRGSYSPIKKSYYAKLAFRPKDLKQDVKTFRVQNMTTAKTRAVVNTGKGKMDTDLKKSRWGNPEILLQDHVVVDSGCFGHMTGNKAYLSDYEDFNGGFMAFGSDPKGDELKFNLFSVSQMYDKKNSILFIKTECVILSPSFKLLDESQVVLRAPRKDDMYSLGLNKIVPFGVKSGSTKVSTGRVAVLELVLIADVFGSAWFCMILPGYSSALQIADVFGCALHVCFTDCRCVWLPGYMSALQIADVFGS
ncbi:hypothetical protein Tco_1396071, partial [Tanacetum coccineum]